jgi:heme exporter protein B
VNRLGRGWLPAFVSTRLVDRGAPSARSSDDPQVSPPTLAGCFISVVRRDLRLAVRQGGNAAMIVSFFVLAVILFPFGVGPAPEILSRIGSGVVWVTALLAALLSLDRLFLADYEDGTLEALTLAPPPLELIVMAKILAHWIVTGLPLVVFAPILGFLMGIEPSSYVIIALAHRTDAPMARASATFEGGPP